MIVHPKFLVLLPLMGLLLPSQAEARVGCHTTEMWERPVYANAGESDRPVSVGYVDSEIYPIRVHYRRDADAERARTVVLPSAEHAWAIEVDQMGWPMPAIDGGLGGSDSFDYYMTNDGTYGGAWTWGPGIDVTPDDGWYSVAAFVALDEQGITDADMDDFVSHEFNHALQYTIDGVERTSFVWESTAEAMEEFVAPDTDLYFIDIPAFQALPFESLLFDSSKPEIREYDRYSFYEYGGSIAGLYLEQAFGQNDGTTLLQLWLNLAQGTTASEPDYVDALAMMGGAEAPTYEDVYLGLAEWRMFASTRDDGAHYVEGGAWGQRSLVATEGSLALSSIDGSTVQPVDAPYDLGTSYWEITVDDALEGNLHFDLAGESGVEWGLVASAWLEGAPARVVKTRAEAGQAVALDLDLTGATMVMVGVSNLGVPNLDAEGDHARASFSLSFQRSLPDTQDSGGDSAIADSDPAGETPDKTEPEEVAGCGCASSPAPMAGLLLLGLPLLLRRRRF